VAGQVVANTTINGCVEVRAAGVTFRNVVFNVAGCFWGVRNFSTGLSVIDSTISCGGFNGNAFGSSDLSLLRVEITRCENGLNVAGRVSVVDSWIHDMNGGQGSAHTDGAQFNEGASDIVFQHNTINVGPANGATSAINHVGRGRRSECTGDDRGQSVRRRHLHPVLRAPGPGGPGAHHR
jgi:hypothetical protein